MGRGGRTRSGRAWRYATAASKNFRRKGCSSVRQRALMADVCLWVNYKDKCRLMTISEGNSGGIEQSVRTDSNLEDPQKKPFLLLSGVVGNRRVPTRAHPKQKQVLESVPARTGLGRVPVRPILVARFRRHGGEKGSSFGQIAGRVGRGKISFMWDRKY